KCSCFLSPISSYSSSPQSEHNTMSLLISTTNVSGFLICPSLLSNGNVVVNPPSRPSYASSESLAPLSLSLSRSTQHLNPSCHFWRSHRCRHQRPPIGAPPLPNPREPPHVNR
ncbi:hypothetical protein VIGAN_04169600, partial [Vigna angularis var. angularis]